MQVSEVRGNIRCSINIQEKYWSVFRDIFSEYIEKMIESTTKQVQETNNNLHNDCENNELVESNSEPVKANANKEIIEN